MADNGSYESTGRETRLLVLVVVVSLAVLLLLARFRFPDTALSVAAPAPGPLSGFAGRAAFDDLASTLSALLSRVAPSIAAVEVQVPAPPPGRTRQAAPRGGRVEEALRPLLMPALRVRSDLALLYVPPGYQPVSMSGSDEPLVVAGIDAKRGLALVRTPARDDFRAPLAAGNMLGFEFVAAIEAAATGPTVQPVFVGRVEAESDERWPGPIFAIGRSSSPIGTFLFSIEGRLIGLIVPHALGAAVVPADALENVANQLAQPQAGSTP